MSARLQGFVLGTAAAIAGVAFARGEQQRSVVGVTTHLNKLRTQIDPSLNLSSAVSQSQSGGVSIDAFDGSITDSAAWSLRVAWNDGVRGVHRFLVEKLIL